MRKRNNLPAALPVVKQDANAIAANLNLSFDKRDLIDVIVNQQLETLQSNIQEKIDAYDEYLKEVRKMIKNIIKTHPNIKSFTKKSDFELRFYVLDNEPLRNDVIVINQYGISIRDNCILLSYGGNCNEIRLSKKGNSVITGHFTFSETPAINAVIKQKTVHINFEIPLDEDISNEIIEKTETFRSEIEGFFKDSYHINLKEAEKKMRLEISKNLIKNTSPELAEFLKQNFGIK